MKRRDFLPLLGAAALIPMCPLSIARAQSASAEAPAGGPQPAASVDLDALRPRIATLLEEARRLDTLETVIATCNGETLGERAYGNSSLTGSTNIKSASKCVVSALVGIAIDKGLLDGVDQKIETVLRAEFPENPDPRLSQVTIGHLLSMRAGLDRMSGPNYGRWVASRNWTRFALAADFVDEPGGDIALFDRIHPPSVRYSHQGLRQADAFAGKGVAGPP